MQSKHAFLFTQTPVFPFSCLWAETNSSLKEAPLDITQLWHIILYDSKLFLFLH